MRLIRFVADDGRVLCGEQCRDGTARVVRDLRGVLVASSAATRLGYLRGRQALVADDDRNMRQLVCTVLDKAGCRCIPCADGAEAMHVLQTQRVDLIVSDIMMPHYNGYELFAAARARSPSLPVVLVTGYGYDPSHSLLRASEEGLQAVLYKPFTPHQLIDQLLRAMESSDGPPASMLQRTDERATVSTLLPPVRPGNLICIGRNYADSGAAPTEPDPDDLEVFLKPTTAVQSSGEPIRLPEGDHERLQVECEGELAVVIGRTMEKVHAEDAMHFVLGYTIANDVTARRWQTAEGPPRWMRGKGFDTFCPLGPALVTGDEIEDPAALTITTTVNGEVIREGSTATMLRPVPRLLSDLSQRVTLEAGTVVLTGAPPRTAGRTSGPILEPGDNVEVHVTGIGTLVSPVAAFGP